MDIKPCNLGLPKLEIVKLKHGPQFALTSGRIRSYINNLKCVRIHEDSLVTNQQLFKPSSLVPNYCNIGITNVKLVMILHEECKR